MLITGFTAGPLQANCYVIAPGDDAECVVIDPGQQAMQGLRELLANHRLRPAAVLLSHGHFDHVASAAAVASEYGADTYIGAGDVGMLDDPLSALSAEFRAGMTQLLGPGESLDDLRPARLTTLAGREHLHLAGVNIKVLAVPGHTPGSVTYLLRTADDEPDALFTGDTLFAGTIGRTDLPGGSMPRILASIGSQLLPLPDDTVVLPGHGGQTTIGAERFSNPFLQGPAAGG